MSFEKLKHNKWTGIGFSTIKYEYPSSRVWFPPPPGVFYYSFSVPYWQIHVMIEENVQSYHSNLVEAGHAPKGCLSRSDFHEQKEVEAFVSHPKHQRAYFDLQNETLEGIGNPEKVVLQVSNALKVGYLLNQQASVYINLNIRLKWMFKLWSWKWDKWFFNTRKEVAIGRCTYWCRDLF